MNLTRMIDELRSQRGKLDILIRAVEDYAGETPRRGRPPKWLTEQRKAEAVANGGVGAIQARTIKSHMSKTNRKRK